MIISLFAHGLPSSLLHNDPVQHFTQESSFWSHFVLQSFVFTHFLVILVSFLYTRVSHDWNDVFKYMYIFIWNVLINYGESFFFDSNTLWYILQQRVFYITRCLSSDKTESFISFQSLYLFVWFASLNLCAVIILFSVPTYIALLSSSYYM